MGIMPRTARAFGYTPEEMYEPKKAIQAGVKCLMSFQQGFSKITAPEERIKFTIASYNAGSGHIYDAQKLAEKYGKNPLLWDDVAEYLRLKSEPHYYNDPVCKHGYLRCSETFRYIRDVMARYKRYQEKAH